MLKAIFLFALNTVPDCLPEFFVRRYSLTAFFPAVIFFSRIVRETACPFSATRITSFEARAPAAERNRRRENVCILVLRSMFIESNVTFLPHKGCTPIPRVFRWTYTIPGKHALLSPLSLSVPLPRKPTTAILRKGGDQTSETNCAVRLNNPRGSCSSAAASFFVIHPVIQV